MKGKTKVKELWNEFKREGRADNRSYRRLLKDFQVAGLTRPNGAIYRYMSRRCPSRISKSFRTYELTNLGRMMLAYLQETRAI